MFKIAQKNEDAKDNFKSEKSKSKSSLTSASNEVYSIN